MNKLKNIASGYRYQTSILCLRALWVTGCFLVPEVVPAQTETVTLLAATEGDATAELEPVVVTGTRTPHLLSDAPVAVQVATRQDIQHSGAKDVAEFLEREGGVHVSPVAGRGSRIEMQGLSSEHVLILVDGRRMIGRINGAIDLTRLHTDSIERIEIVKGPSSALYGADALGGVVNIITRKGDREEVSLTARTDSAGNSEVLANAGGQAGPDLGMQTSGGYYRIASYDLDSQTPGVDGIDGDSRFATGNVRWNLGEQAELDLHAAYSLDNSLRVDGSTGGAVYDTRKRIEEMRVGISPRILFGEADELVVDAYYNRYHDQFLRQQRGSDDNTLDEETIDELGAVNAQLNHAQGAHVLSLGMETQLEKLRADRLSHSGERDRQALFVQDEINLFADRLVLVPGARYDRDSQFGNQVSPKLALRYDLSPNWLLRAGYGQGFRAPDFKQLLLRFDNPSVGYRVEGNPDLRPERSTGFNLGTTVSVNTRQSVSLSAYRNRVTDLIEIVRVQGGSPTVYSYRNVASASVDGVDLESQWRPWSPLDFRLGGGWQRSRDEASRQTLSGRAKYRANASIRFEQAAYALGLRGTWTGRREFSVDINTSGAPTGAGIADAYALMDLRAEYRRLPWNLQFAGGVENLLGAGDAVFLPIKPRTAYLELKKEF